jgi:hypothetical protein
MRPLQREARRLQELRADSSSVEEREAQSQLSSGVIRGVTDFQDTVLSFDKWGD